MTKQKREKTKKSKKGAAQASGVQAKLSQLDGYLKILEQGLSENTAEAIKQAKKDYYMLYTELKEYRGQLKTGKLEKPQKQELQALGALEKYDERRTLALTDKSDEQVEKVIAGLKAKQTQTKNKADANREAAQKGLSNIGNFEELNEKAEAYFASDFKNMGRLLRYYKITRDKFQAYVDKLPNDDKLLVELGGKDKTLSYYRKVITDLNRKVNLHEQTLLKQQEEEQARQMEQIEKIVEEARATVADNSIGDLLSLIAPVATRNEIGGLLQTEETQALFKVSDTGGVISLEPKAQVVQQSRVFFEEPQEPDIEQERSLVKEPQTPVAEHGGALMLADLPLASVTEEAQVKILVSVLNQLGAAQENNAKGALIKQFATDVVKNVERLQKGELTYVSFTTEVDGDIKSFHVDIRQLLTNRSALSKIIFGFGSQGVTTEGIFINLTTPKQVAALGALEGRKVHALSDLGNGANLLEIATNAMQLADNPRKLFESTGQAVTDTALVHHQQAIAAATQSRNLSMPQSGVESGLKPGQIIDLLQEIVTFNVARETIITALTRKESNVARPGGEEQLAMLGGYNVLSQIEMDQQAPLTITAPVTSISEQANIEEQAKAALMANQHNVSVKLSNYFSKGQPNLAESVISITKDLLYGPTNNIESQIKLIRDAEDMLLTIDDRKQHLGELVQEGKSVLASLVQHGIEESAFKHFKEEIAQAEEIFNSLAKNVPLLITAKSDFDKIMESQKVLGALSNQFSTFLSLLQKTNTVIEAIKQSTLDEEGATYVKALQQQHDKEKEPFNKLTQTTDQLIASLSGFNNDQLKELSGSLSDMRERTKEQFKQLGERMKELDSVVVAAARITEARKVLNTLSDHIQTIDDVLTKAGSVVAHWKNGTQLQAGSLSVTDTIAALKRLRDNGLQNSAALQAVSSITVF